VPSHRIDPSSGLWAYQHDFLGDVSAQRPRSEPARSQLFRTPPQGSVDERWQVYRSGYLARLVESLENDYPALRRILGEGPFRSLVARYVQACPPRSFDLGRAGDRLAEMLERDPLSEGLPFLSDLARLEWAVACAFVAADTAPVEWSELQALAPEAVAERPLALAPGARLICSPWPVLDLRSCREQDDGEVDLVVEGRPQNAVVHRRGLEVHCRRLEGFEVRLLEAIARGRRLAAVELGPEDDASVVGECFRRFVSEGLFVSFKEETCPTPTTDVC
jgi:hypothetical protein